LLIQNHRRHVVELMQEWTRVKRDAGPGEVNLALVVDAELFRLDSVTRWLDAADARLRRARAAAIPTVSTVPVTPAPDADPIPTREAKVPR